MNQRLLLLAAFVASLPATASAQQTGAPRDNINALIEAQAKAAGLPSSFVHQVVKRESNYNPNAKGGSALGLMQIKHATARGMGYGGDAAGLYDPQTNLRYGIAYLAGAYRAAKGDLIQAYNYYNKGYYYAAKRLGITTDVAADVPTAPRSGTAFGSLFGQRPAVDPNVTAANTALAYAPSPATDPGPTEVVEVPLPPRRPAFRSDVALSDPVTATVAGARSADLAALSVAPQAASLAMSAEPPVTETVEVPLPPRRPSLVQLASVGRPIVAKKAPVAGTTLEASALPTAQ
jgi:hypothetical protein